MTRRLPLLLALGAAGPAWGAPDPTALEAAWQAALPAISAGDAVTVELSTKDFVALSLGEPVVHRVDAPEGAFAASAVWVPVALPYAWIAVQDASDRPLDGDMVHEWLPGETPGRRQVYMLLGLPWPIADRQWVSDFQADAALHARTGGTVWRRTWTVADPALAPNPSPDAVWVEVNRGAWTLLQAEGGTLCVLTVRTVIGGAIPASVSNTFARGALRDTMRSLARLAPGTAAHYTGSHHVVHAPDGAPISPASP